MTRLKDSGETISTGQRRSCSDDLAARSGTIEPLSIFLGTRRFWIALSEQFVERIPAPLPRLHHQPAAPLRLQPFATANRVQRPATFSIRATASIKFSSELA